MTSPDEVRVLHICTRYLRGGSEKRLADLIGAIPEWQHDVVVGLESELELAKGQLRARNLTIEPSLVREIAPRNDALATARLCRLIHRGRYDLVVTHQSKAGIVGRSAAFLAGRKPVVHSLSMANFGPGYSAKASTTFRLAERLMSNGTAAYAAVGHDLANRYTEIGVPANKIHVIRSGVRIPSTIDRTDARLALQTQFGIPLTRPLIAYIGSLDERKGVLDLPSVLAGVRRIIPDAFLAIAGVGPLVDGLTSKLTDLRLTADAALLGFVTPIDDLVVGADLLVLLSSAEGVPQVLVQAAAVGTPFVSYDVDGTAELMALGAHGTVVHIGDVSKAIEAAAALLRSGHRAASIDASSWDSANIARGYREVVMGVVHRART